MPLLRVLLVDDEALALVRLKSLLADIAEPRVQVVGEASFAERALAILKDHTVDLVLLDIGMPVKDGLQLAAAMRALPAPAPAVVFVTAHAEHALRAFELDAVDYLTKPVRKERLQAALQRVAQRLAPRAAAAAAEAGPVLVVNDRGRVLRLPLAEVLYLKAELKYVTLRTAEHSYVLDDALSDLEARLGAGFIRIHRNALVARGAVRALERRAASEPGPDDGGAEGWAVRVAPTDEWLAVSRRQLTAVREALAEGSVAGGEGGG